MEVLVSNAYWYPLDSKQWEFKQPYPPLATLWAAAVIRDLGFSVSLFDNNLKQGPAEITEHIASVRPTYSVIYDDGFNYLTKMCLTVMREAAFVVAQKSKDSGAIVIISSSDSTDHYEEYFNHGVDYVIRGEGEETLAELLDCLKKNEDPSAIHGIAFRKTRTIVTPPRAVMKNLDKLPLPAWNLIDLDPYRKIWNDHHGYFSLNLATTRGCPYKCNWCAKPIYGNRYNTRSPLQVVDEIELLLSIYKPDHFWMSDDIFGLKPDWIKEFRSLVTERKLSFRYKIQSRADLLVKEETVLALAQSGAETVWLGAESGSQKVLDAMDKGITISEIREASQLLRKNNVRSGFFLQFGYPGEKLQDIEATIKMVLNLMPDEIGISVSYPLPGTKFYDNVRAELMQKQNWSDSDDLAMMFKGTFAPAFYKVLHRYVHSRYRIQRGLNQLKKKTNNPLTGGFNFRNLLSMIYHIPVSFLQSYQLRKLSREI